MNEQVERVAAFGNRDGSVDDASDSYSTATEHTLDSRLPDAELSRNQSSLTVYYSIDHGNATPFEEPSYADNCSKVTDDAVVAQVSRLSTEHPAERVTCDGEDSGTGSKPSGASNSDESHAVAPPVASSGTAGLGASTSVAKSAKLCDSYFSTTASDREKEIILQFETVNDQQVKALMWFQRFGALLALIAMSVLLRVKVSGDLADSLNHNEIQIANLVVGGFCLVVLLFTILWVLVSVWRAIARQGVWSARRRRVFQLAFIILVCQLGSCCAYLATNIILVGDCAIMKNYRANISMFVVQSTFLNTIVFLYLMQGHNKVPASSSPIHILNRKLRQCFGPSIESTVSDVRQRFGSNRDTPANGTARSSDTQSAKWWSKLIPWRHPRATSAVAADHALALVMDTSRWNHLFKFMLWVLAEAMVIWAAVLIIQKTDEQVVAGDAFLTAGCPTLQTLQPAFDDPSSYFCPNITREDTPDDLAFRVHSQSIDLYLEMKQRQDDQMFCSGKSIVDVTCSPSESKQASDGFVGLQRTAMALVVEWVLLNQDKHILVVTPTSLDYKPAPSGTVAPLIEGCENVSANVAAMVPDGIHAALATYGKAYQEFDAVLLLTEAEKTRLRKVYAQVISMEGGISNGTTDFFSVFGTGMVVRSSFDNNAARPAVIVQVTTLAVAWALYSFHVLLALRWLKTQPYIPFRTGNVLLRWEIRSMFLLFCVMNLSWLLLWFLKEDSASTVWTGIVGVWMPLQISGTWVAIELAVLYRPRLVNELTKPLQRVLQEFSWSARQNTVRAKPPVPRAPLQQESLSAVMAPARKTSEPCFCYETALKAFTWARLAYDLYEPACAKIEHLLKLGMETCELKEFGKVYHAGLDAAVVIGWGHKGMVIAFRGTTSLRNAITDVKAWMNTINNSLTKNSTIRIPESEFEHPGVKRTVRNQLADLVSWPAQAHKGFWSCWQALKPEVLNYVMDVLFFVKPHDKFSILVTGHSLGGAVAVVAGPDISRLLHSHELQAVELCCYTLGAPRVGNSKFAEMCNIHVPDTWHIINDQDMVPRLDPFTKLLIPYKRTGHQVLINRNGDMIVRPSFPERTLLVMPFMTHRSVHHHMLTSYSESLCSIVSAQRSGKGFDDGMMAVEEMIRHNAALQRILDLLELERVLSKQKDSRRALHPNVNLVQRVMRAVFLTLCAYPCNVGEHPADMRTLSLDLPPTDPQGAPTPLTASRPPSSLSPV